MEEREDVGQCLLEYEHDCKLTHCGMTFFQCGASPILIFTDLEQSVSITNSIESVASTAFASLSNLVALLRMNLFTHRDLMAWLDKPFATPPDPQDKLQADLVFA